MNLRKVFDPETQQRADNFENYVETHTTMSAAQVMSTGDITSFKVRQDKFNMNKLIRSNLENLDWGE